MSNNWTFDQVPDQHSRTALVTGANTGIGYDTALALAKRGAHVVLACRSRERGADAARRMEAEQPAGSVQFLPLDLGNLASVRMFAKTFLARYERLDLLINNAGVMIPPLSKSEDGFELQIGVNYFGHFALSGLLFDRLTATPGARLVTVSSTASRQGRIDFDNFHGEKPYKAWREYCQSKLANLLFSLELQRRLDREGHALIATAAHPGWTSTDLQRHSGFFGFFSPIFGMATNQGALPILYAATAPEAEAGGYYGPDGFLEMRGYPAPAQIPPRAQDTQTAQRLWETTEKLTGITFLSETPVPA